MCSPSRTRRAVALVAGLVTSLVLLPATPARAGVPVVVLDGTGWGHGVGLSQWGAEHLARHGRSRVEILATFYGGASLAQATGPVRVTVRPAGSATTTLSFPDGGEVRSPLEGPQAPGFPIPVAPGGRVRVTSDGSAYRVDPLVAGQGVSPAVRYRQDECLWGLLCPTTTAAPGPTTTTTAAPGSPAPSGPAGPTPPPASTGAAPASATAGGPVWAVPAAGGSTTVDERGRSYRGVIEATGGSALRLVNHVGVEDYLRGMAEVPGTWPPAAVQAQVVAARTYALRAMQVSGELCDDARCQVYVGVGAESPGQDAAVAATAGRVIVYGGALAAAVYSADAGGFSATTEEGFGTPDGTYPYLRAHLYETDNPLPWHVEVGLGDVASRLGYGGALTGVRLGRTGPSARALTVVLEGSAGERTVSGRDFARALGLRSTRFTVALGTADGTPLPPPPAGEEVQALPDETAALARTPSRPAGGDRLDAARPAAGTGPAARPLAPDPRRPRLLALVATVAAAGVLGAQVPVLLAAGGGPAGLGRRTRHVRSWARWRALRPPAR